MAVDNQGNESYKIGITKNPVEKRLKQLQTGNPSKIKILHVYETPNYLKVESMLHRKYQTLTESNNEWRILSNEQIFSFLDDCKKADELITMLLKENHFYK